jgi:phage-related minor tail protein
VAVKYLPGALMSSDLLTKNLPGLLFVKHAANYVTDDDVAVEEAEERASGTVKSAYHKDEVEAQDEINERLPSIGKANHHEDEEEVRMGEKRLYTDYSQVEVKEQRENGVVMNDGEDGKDWMLGMETVKNG